MSLLMLTVCYKKFLVGGDDMRKIAERKRVTTTVHLLPESMDRFRRLAVERGLTLGQLVEELLRVYSEYEG